MRILVVEDNPDDTDFLCATLRRAGREDLSVRTFSNLTDARATLGNEEFDVVLLDMHLPDAAGADCIDGIQSADDTVPIVVLSGEGDENYAIEILNRGAQDYLVKWEGDGKSILRSIRYAIERKRTERELQYLARYDSLTGIPNRQYLQDQLERATCIARRQTLVLGLLFLDIDRFKVVNDTLGHALGDDLLISVVERLKSCIRDGDLLARLGGDEFAVLFEDIAGAIELEAIAKKVVAAFNEPFAIAGREVPVTASIGLTLFPADDYSATALLNNADIAMYQAKDHGRNNFKFFTKRMHEEIIRYHDLETGLRDALANDKFELAYQPQVNLSNGEVESLEALLRWKHPDRGLISAGEFITVAEECGVVVPIGSWVLESACRQISAWQEAGTEPRRISVNIAPIHFQQPNFAREVQNILTEYSIDPELVELELTEHSLMTDTAQVRDCLHHLKRIGVRLAIDDFGTGYSCLNYLRRFPIDVLKLDRSFVADIEDTPDGRAVCSVILLIGQRLSLDTIAEGVETEAQLTFLRDHGCRLGQGYYFGQPAPAHTLDRVLWSFPRAAKKQVTASELGEDDVEGSLTATHAEL